MDTPQQYPTMWTTGYLPNGAKVSFTFPIRNEFEAYKQAVEITNKLLADGFMLTEPGLEEGEKKEQVGYFVRRNKDNNDGTTTPIIDCYPANDKTIFKFISVYLNTQEDVDAFEKASGWTLKNCTSWDTDTAPQRDNKRAPFLKPVSPFSAVYKANPYYEEGNKKPKHLFVRWEGSRPAVSPQPTANVAASEPPKAEPARNSELRNESIVITRIEARSDSAGWYGYGMFSDGIGTHETRVNLFAPEDPQKITAKGYEWHTGAVEIPVTLLIDRNMARIDKVLPKEPVGQSSANGHPDAKSGQSSDPTWFGTHVNECWGAVKQYLLTNVYEKNAYAMKGSMWKRGVSADKEASLPSGDWANRTAGDLIHMLEARHDNEQPIAEAS